MCFDLDFEWGSQVTVEHMWGPRRPLVRRQLQSAGEGDDGSGPSGAA